MIRESRVQPLLLIFEDLHWIDSETQAFLDGLVESADPPDPAAAEAGYRGALSIANALAIRPLVAHCHFGLGKLSRRTGQREQSQEHLAIATTMYREMGMANWLEKAETEMRSLA